MRIFVQAKTKARENRVEKIGANHFRVFAKEPPEKGRANASITKTIAKYFSVSPSRVRIVSGQTGRKKVLEIDFPNL